MPSSLKELRAALSEKLTAALASNRSRQAQSMAGKCIVAAPGKAFGHPAWLAASAAYLYARSRRFVRFAREIPHMCYQAR